jgi:TonB family protein
MPISAPASWLLFAVGAWGTPPPLAALGQPSEPGPMILPDSGPPTSSEAPAPDAAGAALAAAEADAGALDEDPSDQDPAGARRRRFTSFMKRVQRMVGQRWGQQAYQPEKRSTDLSVALTGDGALLKAEVARSCGDPRLDQAVVAAFRAAAPFPHPPRELLAADGVMRLKFGFVFDPKEPETRAFWIPASDGGAGGASDGGSPR